MIKKKMWVLEGHLKFKNCELITNEERKKMLPYIVKKLKPVWVTDRDALEVIKLFIKHNDGYNIDGEKRIIGDDISSCKNWFKLVKKAKQIIKNWDGG